MYPTSAGDDSAPIVIGHVLYGWRLRNRMIATLTLLVFVTAAAVTDIVWHKIFNATTYPGMLAALVLTGTRSMFEARNSGEVVGDIAKLDAISPIGIDASLAGLAICWGLMVFTYLLFGVGGGDVKLIAMLGAFLGTELGLGAIMWTLLFAAVVAIALLIWREGALGLLIKIGRYLAAMFKSGVAQPPVEEDRRALQMPLFLGPCALAAALMVCFDLVQYLPFH